MRYVEPLKSGATRDRSRGVVHAGQIAFMRAIRSFDVQALEARQLLAVKPVDFGNYAIRFDQLNYLMPDVGPATRRRSEMLPLPTVVISGFLGAGKTTLLNRLLAHGIPGKRAGVIVNDFGKLNVDLN